MSIDFEKDGFVLSLARDDDDVRAAQRLRYDVFVQELNGCGTGVDHVAKLERDQFDDAADHLILRDSVNNEVIGAYRLMTDCNAQDVGGFYSEAEFDLTPLRNSGHRLLELGRSCVRADHRSGPALFHLWTGLARYVAMTQTDLLFGVASLPGTDLAALQTPLSLLHHKYRAPKAVRVQSRQRHVLNLTDTEKLDARAAMVALPPLVKSYLRLGARVGEGVFVDTAFQCTDVCMVMDVAAMNDRASSRYQRAAAK